MAINSYDIVSTLQALGMMKYWKGKHIILKKQVSFEFIDTITYFRFQVRSFLSQPKYYEKFYFVIVLPPHIFFYCQYAFLYNNNLRVA